MAWAVKADPISQLEEDLECSVCLEVLKDPRTLPCCHSFCKDCLEGVVQTCRATAPHGRPIQEIPCPNCRAMFPLDPEKHVADMPRNHFICNLVKVTAVLDRGIGVPCSHNCSQSYSVARCVTCEKFLCRECLTGHNNYRGNNGHSVLTMEELSKPENRKKIKDKMYCNEHSGKKLKVYCETCDQLICKDCMDFKHVKQEGHSCFLVKDVANNYKELLASNNKAMEDALTQGHIFIERLSLTTKQLDRDAQNAKMQIAQRKESIARRVLKLLDEKAECLSKKVDKIHDGKRANLDRQTEEINQFVENIKTSVQLSKKLVDQGTEEEVISSQKMMLDNANNLLAKREENFKAPIPVAKLRYTIKGPIHEDIFRGLKDSLGEVNEEGGAFPLPSHWEFQLIDRSTGKEHDVYSFPIEKNTSEYDHIHDKFIASLSLTTPNAEVVKIERIQNPRLYQIYEGQKKKMIDGGNEMKLYHGTAKNAVENINKTGFNRAYCGKNAVRFGKGVYFAKEAWYSARKVYAALDDKGLQYIYVARVLVGKFTKGKEGLIVPPTVDKNNQTVVYDSVADDVQKPTMFIIFHDYQSYPEYLITFKPN